MTTIMDRFIFTSVAMTCVALIQTIFTCKGSVWGPAFKPVADAVQYITWVIVVCMAGHTPDDGFMSATNVHPTPSHSLAPGTVSDYIPPNSGCQLFTCNTINYVNTVTRWQSPKFDD